MLFLFANDCFEEERKFCNNISVNDVLSFKHMLNYDCVIYRGWMLTEEEYNKLVNCVKENNGCCITNTNMYLNAHLLPNWYNHFESVTFETKVFKDANVNEINDFLNNSQWNKYFVKDFVKSLTTSRGSVANNKKEVFDIISQMNYYGINGGICLRKYYNLKRDTEHRNFVFNKKIYTENNDVYISEEIKEKVLSFNSLFFSFDTCFDENNKQYIVEIGDGQVSSFKWNINSIENFYKKLANN